jgi:hypothetical protein
MVRQTSDANGDGAAEDKRDQAAIAEGRALLDEFHGFHLPENAHLRATAFRDNAIRLIILHTHLGIEDFIRWKVHRALSETTAPCRTRERCVVHAW